MKKLAKLGFRLHLPNLDYSAHDCIFLLCYTSDCVEISFLIHEFFHYGMRNIDDVIKWIASIFFHNLNLILLKPFKRIIDNRLVVILHILNVRINNAH